MVKVFIPINKSKIKTGARGFWRNDTGRTYYDYLKIINYRQENIGLYYRDLFINYLETIKTGYKQEAIFYTDNGQGFIYYSKDKIEVLKNRIYQDITGNLKEAIKEAIKKYNGVTVYKNNNRYFLEVFYND
jgi:hypothetical protein